MAEARLVPPLFTHRFRWGALFLTRWSKRLIEYHLLEPTILGFQTLERRDLLTSKAGCCVAMPVLSLQLPLPPVIQRLRYLMLR